jgi:hypothetical protein
MKYVFLFISLSPTNCEKDNEKQNNAQNDQTKIEEMYIYLICDDIHFNNTSVLFGELTIFFFCVP